jgi:release factor glutamine methyltransferase
VKLTSTYLAEHGSSSARLDAELLIAHALGLRRIDLYLQFDRQIEEPDLAAIRQLVRRRGRGEPIAYISGAREFFSRSFEVGPDVLVPRPETETLVGAVLDGARDRENLVIADLGTGSGCIAVTLAAELPHARIIATDVSGAALEVARRNAVRHGVDERVTFAQGVWGGALETPVDVVVSNPPYVTVEEMQLLPRDVADFEPAIALAAGEDGLESYRSLLTSLPGKLCDNATIALEVDPRRADAVVQLVMAGYPSATTRIADDLTHSPRVVVARVGDAYQAR